MQKTYFGLEVVDGKFVRKSDIQKLPFYAFWEASAIGSTFMQIDSEDLIYLHDWTRFAVLFIKTGKHRFS